MITLFIDTCHHNLIVGIYRDNQELILLNEKNDNHLSERLLPLIDRAFLQANLDINDTENIIVANGPGSFTGVRIGVTVAKTLAYSLGCKIHTVSELRIMATSSFTTKYVVPLIDARRDAVYGAMYSDMLESVIEDTYIQLTDLLEKIKEITTLDQVTFVTYESFDNITSLVPTINIASVVSENLNGDGILSHLVNPNYLKKTEAEEKLGV